jgi:hypothetical protein
LKGGHSNQPNVDVDNRRVAREEMQPGWNVWGGVVSWFQAENQTRKTVKNKMRCGLRRPPDDGATPQPTKNKWAQQRREKRQCTRLGWSAGEARIDHLVADMIFKKIDVFN